MTSKGRNPLVTHHAAKPLPDAIETPGTGARNLQNRRETTAPRATKRDVASYIEGLTAGLRMMAQSADLDTLAYFLEMARLEASIQVERLAHSGIDTDDMTEF